MEQLPMWPWGHAAVGYLLWSALTSRIVGRRPRGPEVWLLGLGTQFPDFVDKPLAWRFGLLPAGRSLAHSLLTASVVIAIAYVLANRRGHGPLALAFGVGYVSHSFADAASAIWSGEHAELTYLLWPVLPAPTYGSDSVAVNSEGMALWGFVALELVLVALAVARWTLDGKPGLPSVLGRLHAGVR